LLSTDKSELEEEIESWKGFPWALRREDRELWEAMIDEVRTRYGEAIEKSGKDFATDPFFMSLLLAQQKTIKLLKAEVEARRARATDSLQHPELDAST
jgi:hypothetical protein